MTEAFRFSGSPYFGEGLGHAVKAQGVKLVESRMIEQDRFS